MPLTLMRGNRMIKQNVEEETVKDELDDIDEGLVDKVQASLDTINGEDTEEESTDDQQTDDDDSTPEDQADDDASTSDDEPDEDVDEDTDEDKDKDKDKDKDTKEVQLPDAYYRAAIHQGWTPDEIKEFFEANPELAIKTLAKNHESTNKLNSEFARMGRIKPEDKKVTDSETATEATTIPPHIRLTFRTVMNPIRIIIFNFCATFKTGKMLDRHLISPTLFMWIVFLFLFFLISFSIRLKLCTGLFKPALHVLCAFSIWYSFLRFGFGFRFRLWFSSRLLILIKFFTNILMQFSYVVNKRLVCFFLRFFFRLWHYAPLYILDNFLPTVFSNFNYAATSSVAFTRLAA